MKSSTEYWRDYRDRFVSMGLSVPRSRNTPARPAFIGCDGEGAGLDSLGRQNFLLFRIGDSELYTGSSLTTSDCLEHICNAPNSKSAILVGFSFGYDTTMILKDLSDERKAHLFRNKERGSGKSPYTYYGNYGIDYLPKQYLRCCRLRRHGDTVSVIPGSSRTIYETFGFFQTSFLRALKQFEIGEEYLELIERNKDARSQFDVMTPEIREYNRIECELLAQLMEKMRDNCYAANIRPLTWSGAGKLAAALHKREHTMPRREVERLVQTELMSMAGEAYYGGRFEITRTGKLGYPIWEYDIRSAYPAAMQSLSCLEHGTWEKQDGLFKHMDGQLYIASIHFKNNLPIAPGRLGGLPVRHKKGHLFWPMEGNGIYWSCEIESARKLGFYIRCRNAYVYHRNCDCKPFVWVNDLYNYRRRIGSSGEGYPIKLGINSLYGKLAQRIGAAPYRNILWAGLITAQVRTWLNEAIALNPTGIVMLATDGIYSDKPLALDIGDNLGQWEVAEIKNGMFIVQPGLYWGAKKPKTRGMPFKYFEEPGRTEHFEHVFGEWLQYDNSAHRTKLSVPSVSVFIRQFTGIKIAHSRGKPDTAGVWADVEKHISFDWSNKRLGYEHREGHVITMPYPGNKKLVSYAHADLVSDGTAGQLDAIRNELEDQPDYFDLGIPWKD